MSSSLSVRSSFRDCVKDSIPNITILDVFSEDAIIPENYLDAYILIIFSEKTISQSFNSLKFVEILPSISIHSRFPIQINESKEKTYNISSGIFSILLSNEYLSQKKKIYKEDQIRIHRSIKNPISSRGICCNSLLGIRFVQVNETQTFSEIIIIPKFSYSEPSLIKFETTSNKEINYSNSRKKQKSTENINSSNEKKKRKNLISSFQNSFRKKE